MENEKELFPLMPESVKEGLASSLLRAVRKWKGATEEQLRPYISSINLLGVFFHSVYDKGTRDGTVRTDLPEGKMFAATCHIMLAVAVRFAQGLLYSADNEKDRTEEFELLKGMILDKFTVKK